MPEIQNARGDIFVSEVFTCITSLEIKCLFSQEYSWYLLTQNFPQELTYLWRASCLHSPSQPLHPTPRTTWASQVFVSTYSKKEWQFPGCECQLSPAAWGACPLYQFWLEQYSGRERGAERGIWRGVKDERERERTHTYSTQVTILLMTTVTLLFQTKKKYGLASMFIWIIQCWKRPPEYQVFVALSQGEPSK